MNGLTAFILQKLKKLFFKVPFSVDDYRQRLMTYTFALEDQIVLNVYEAGLADGSGAGTLTKDTDSGANNNQYDYDRNLEGNYLTIATAGTGIGSVTIGDKIVVENGVFLGTVTSPITVEVTGGTLTFTGFETISGTSAGKLFYTYTLGSAVNHGASGDADDNFTNDLNLTVTDKNGVAASDRTIHINIVDDAPVAKDITDITARADGGEQMGKLDAFVFGADGAAEQNGVTVRGGQYGELTLDADGNWTYTPNADASTIAANATVNDEFTYTLKDKDGDERDGKITVKVTGGDTPQPPEPITITPVEGSQDTVHEAAMPGGNPVGGETKTAKGALKIDATAVVQGINVKFGDETGTVALNGVTATFNTDDGELKLTYNAEDGNLEYEYTLNARAEHSDQGRDILPHTFTVTVTDGTQPTSSYYLEIKVVDDVPAGETIAWNASPLEAKLNASISLKPAFAFGADGAADSGAVVLVNDEGEALTPDANGVYKLQYGRLTIKNGTWMYKIGGNGQTDPYDKGVYIKHGTTETETIKYRITDKDGDTAEGELTLKLTGQDHDVSVTGNTGVTVREKELSTSGAGTLVIHAYDDLGVVTIGGEAVTDANGKLLEGVEIPDGDVGVLTVTSITGGGLANNGDYTLTYTYKLNKAVTHTKPNNDAKLTRTLAVVAKDQSGEKSTGKANITVTMKTTRPPSPETRPPTSPAWIR